MKKMYLLMAAALFTVAGMAQEHDHSKHSHAKEGAKAEVKPAVQPAVALDKPVSEDNLSLGEAAYNFGKIQQGKPVTHDFAIKNSGKTELKLDNVQASCGCTTPQWKPGPYKAGESAVITVGYNAAAPGPFTKTITVTYNGGLSKVITINGEVVAAPATPAPENKGVQMLKGGK